MYMNPEIRAWLDQYEAQAADAPPIEEVPLEDSRAGFSELFKVIDAPPRPMHITDEVMIPGPNGDIRCVRYVPRESDELLPVLVYYHGGGTVLLSPEDYKGTITAFAAEADCIAIAPDYHLAPENPFPGPLEECHAVLNWTLENAQTIGGDPNRVAVAGDSGGGYLTAAVCLEAKLKNTPQPIYQVIIYPMVDNAGKTASYTEMDYFLNEEVMDWVLPYAFGDVKNRVNPRASPILAEDLSGLAPTTIITAELCPLRDEGKAYANRLRKAGVPTLYYCYEGQIHGFFSFGAICEESKLAVIHVAGILKHAFRTKAATKEIPAVM